MNYNRARADYGDFKEIEVKVVTKDGFTFVYRFEQPPGAHASADIKYNVESETDFYGYLTNQKREFTLTIKQ